MLVVCLLSQNKNIMRNENILPNQLVPIEIRLEVYKRCVEIITNKEDVHGFKYDENYQLCIILPCILWDLEHYLDDAPNGEWWGTQGTKKMFPQLNEVIISEIELGDSTEIRNSLRIRYLNEFITQLESIK